PLRAAATSVHRGPPRCDAAGWSARRATDRDPGPGAPRPPDACRVPLRGPLRPCGRRVPSCAGGAHQDLEPRGPLHPGRRARAARSGGVSEVAATEGVEEGPRLGDEVVRTEGLTKHFPLKRSARHPGDGPEVRAVDGVDLSIAAGATLGLVGESGSGKSTVARLVLRLMPPTAGRIFFEGNDITNAKGGALRALRPQMLLACQDPYSWFDPQATVLRSVIEPLQAEGRSRAECNARAEELIDLVGLARDHLQRYPRELSGGQLQRAGIARALATG